MTTAVTIMGGNLVKKVKVDADLLEDLFYHLEMGGHRPPGTKRAKGQWHEPTKDCHSCRLAERIEQAVGRKLAGGRDIVEISGQGADGSPMRIVLGD